jgi:hypothetical protein
MFVDLFDSKMFSFLLEFRFTPMMMMMMMTMWRRRRKKKMSSPLRLWYDEKKFFIQNLHDP